MTATLCEARKVRKAFGDRIVVDGFDLTIGDGEMVALTGPSGCGKSTVLNMLGLLESPDGGEIELCGRPVPSIRSRQARQLLRHTIGYLFQNSALIDSESVELNLKVAQRYVKESSAALAAQRGTALRTVGLPGSERRRVYSLSGGEQQRLAMARLLLKPCQLILADEPTGSLDASNRDDILTLLLTMRGAGKSIVLVTHDPAVAAACDRVVGLVDGTDHLNRTLEPPAH